MTYQSRIDRRLSRARGRLVAGGVASIDLRQRMKLSRERVAEGSIFSDWKKVRDDVRRGVSLIASELERA